MDNMKNPSEAAAAGTPRRLVEVFLLFSKIGLSSFGGGVSAWMHMELVERRNWLSEPEFAAALAFARIMPGASIVNFAVLIGHRLIGLRGAIVAVLGILVGPSLTVIVLAIFYRRFAGTTVVDTVLAGAAASAVGLLFSMGIKSASRIGRAGLTSARRPAPGVGAVVVLAAIFVLVGVLRFPTVPVVLCLAPFSVALAMLAGGSGPLKRGCDG
jgi:chromate transporter